VNHGSRAIRVSDNAALGCNGTPTFADAPQCFAKFFSADLATTRDNFRQAALDIESLVAAIQNCSGTACGPLHVDPTKIGYLSHSLGGFIGTLAVALDDDIKADVINVGGAGLLDIIENTDRLDFRCSLVNDLIDAGVLTGDKWTGGDTGLCLTEEWKTQPKYPTFANAARWVIDPAEGANYYGWLATRTSLLQEVVDDDTVPNVTSEQLGALTGLEAQQADPYPPTTASLAITEDPTASKWVTYETLPANAGMGFPGNTYGHGSLLQPETAGADGGAATARMQKDMLTYLFTNVIAN
jgi:hypothetical protein